MKVVEIVFNLFLYLQQIRFNYVIKNLKDISYMANKYSKAILFFAFFFLINVIWAQGPPPPPPPVDPALPIDGGILGLFAAGVGYAIKKIHDQSKK